MVHQPSKSHQSTVSLKDIQWLENEVTEITRQMLEDAEKVPLISDRASSKMRSSASRGKHRQAAEAARVGVADAFAMVDAHADRLEQATRKVLGEVRRHDESAYAFVVRMTESIGSLEGVLRIIEKNGLRVSA